jgi:hypothetical protein
MSQECGDEPVDVFETEHRRAKQEHKCHACHETISRGHTYWRVAVLFEGAWDITKQCERCRRIYEHLVKVNPCDSGEALPALNLRCGHTYEEVHGREPPPEIAALAFALPGETQ